MKKTFKRGFTLIELLVVISIIGILASILLPALTRAKVAAKVTQARTEISNLKGAIESYYQTYQRYPTSQQVRKDGVSNFSPDFTYGTWNGSSLAYQPQGVRQATSVPPTPSGNIMTNNSEVIAILMDQDRSQPNNVKKGNPENRQGRVFFTPNGSSVADGPGLSSVDGILRDPWGNPYIISLDLNYDDSTRDAFYRGDKVAMDTKTGQGLNGFIKAGRDSWEQRVGVMVWSFGPDRMANPNVTANTRENKDNITSW